MMHYAKLFYRALSGHVAALPQGEARAHADARPGE